MIFYIKNLFKFCYKKYAINDIKLFVNIFKTNIPARISIYI